MSLPTIPDAAVGSVAAALIAAFIGFVGLVIAKENKTSEFRQAWIDALRAELSQMIANVNAIRGATVAEYESKQDLFNATRELFINANSAATAIRLRLNPAEAECKAILDCIEELEKLTEQKPIDLKACQACEEKMIGTAHAVLKKEWVRVRRGELTFALAKWGGFAVAVAMLVWLLFTWASAGLEVTSTGKTRANTPTMQSAPTINR